MFLVWFNHITLMLHGVHHTYSAVLNKQGETGWYSKDCNGKLQHGLPACDIYLCPNCLRFNGGLVSHALVFCISLDEPWRTFLGRIYTVHHCYSWEIRHWFGWSWQVDGDRCSHAISCFGLQHPHWWIYLRFQGETSVWPQRTPLCLNTLDSTLHVPWAELNVEW